MTARTTALDRAEISRRNGRLSRGPKSPETKLRSRMNALKHGMTARILLPGEDEDAFRRHVADFLDALEPRNAAEAALAEQAALATWQIRRGERGEASRVAAAVRAAEASAGLENKDEVAAMGYWLLAGNLRARQDAAASLFPFLSEDRKDPFRRGRGDPRHIVLRLEATAEGCRSLLEQWARLRRALEGGGDWRTNELILAVQLRGQRPLGRDILEWQDLLETVPPEDQPEVVAEARRRLLLQWEESLPEDPAGRRAALLLSVERETARLEERRAAHREREAADRAELADRLAVDTTPEGERMRRHQLDCDRKLHRAINTLLKLRRADAAAASREPDGPDPEPSGSVRRATDGMDAPGAEPEAPADSVEPSPSGDLDAPARCSSEPDRPVVSQNEPSPIAADVRIPQNEPAPPADGAPIWQNEPSPPAAADRIPQNEPSPPGDGAAISQNEPTTPGRLSAPAVPALVFALVILLAAGLSAAFAGALTGPAGQADLPGRGGLTRRARGSTDLRGPWEFPSVGSLRRARISWDGEFHAEMQGIEEFHPVAKSIVAAPPRQDTPAGFPGGLPAVACAVTLGSYAWPVEERRSCSCAGTAAHPAGAFPYTLWMIKKPRPAASAAAGGIRPMVRCARIWGAASMRQPECHQERKYHGPGLLAAAALACAAGLATAAEGDRPGLEYNRDIRPILAENCFACHGPDSAARKADLRLDRREAAIEAGAIVPKDPESSELIARINAEDPKELMPPRATTKTLSAREKETLRRWIAEGAAYQPHWSLIPPKRPALPKVKDPSWARNPIDRFVLAKLEENGLRPAPEADRRTLARRLSLDLTGLPPAPGLVEAYVNDPSPRAYEDLVTRLLDSPRWGEHRARYWLDAARYADTNGYHFDNYREAWAYRDWVIAAFNRNVPFDRFTIEQLAGDLLPGHTLDQEVASGFNRCNATTNEGGVIPEEYKVLYARDRTETVSTIWMGLTAGCAVCHDHKFDPISQREFYELSAFFNNTTQPVMDGNVKDTPPTVFMPEAADRRRWEALSAELKGVRGQLAARKTSARPEFDRWLAAAKPDELAGSVPAAGLRLAANAPVPDPAAWPETRFEAADSGDFEKDHAFSYGAWVKLPRRGMTGSVLARMDDTHDYRGWDIWLEENRIATHIVHKWPDDALKVTARARCPPMPGPTCWPLTTARARPRA